MRAITFAVALVRLVVLAVVFGFIAACAKPSVSHAASRPSADSVTTVVQNIRMGGV